MDLKFYFMGDVWYFNFPKDLVYKVMCTISVYDHTLDKHGPIGNGNYQVVTTVSSKDSLSLQLAIRKDFNSRYCTGLKKNFKSSKFGRKYELRLPEEKYKTFKALMKAKGCKAEKISLNEGDGNINIFVIIPQGEVVKIKTAIARYAKQNGF